LAQDRQVCAGQSYTIFSAAEATGASSVTYTWYENGEPVPNSNTASLEVTAAEATPGTYSYVRMAANDDCADGVPSNTFTVVVHAVPSVTLSSASGSNNQTVNSGTTITPIVYTASNASTISLTGALPPGVSSSGSGTVLTISGTPAETGTFNYSVTTVNSNNCTNATASGTITVNNACYSSYTTGGPATAFSTNTWVIDGLTWSDRIVANPSNCANPTSLASSDPLPPAQYITYGDRHYYNWPCAANSINGGTNAELCPSGWRLPTLDDFWWITNTSSGCTAAIMVDTWGSGGAIDGNNVANRYDGYYWSSTLSPGTGTDPYCLNFTTTTPPGPSVSMLTRYRRYGFQVRCVKGN
jgi:hypothetical protein